jgi:carbamoyltransferase
MTILGINAYHADSSAAIFVNGKLKAAIEEERFRRLKHWAGFPILAIEYCLKEAGIKYDDVDYFAIGRDPKAKYFNKLFYLIRNFNGDLNAIKTRNQNSKKVKSLADELSTHFNVNKEIFSNKIVNIEHHRSHLASAFFASPFEEAACLSIDASGDFTTTMLGVGKGNEIKVLDSVDFPHSVGLFYTAFTQLLGFPHFGDEYKVMGMAPYGEPKYLNELKDVVSLQNNGLFKLNLSYFKNGTKGIISHVNNQQIVSTLFSEKMIQKFGPQRLKEESLTQYHKDLAASVQLFTEQIIFHLVEGLYKKTKLKNLCLAGGVAQNSVANGKILQNTSFEKIYIPSAGHDAGISIGAALYTQHHILDFPRQPSIQSAYTGSSFSNEEIKKFLLERKIHFLELQDEKLNNAIVECLINGGVVGWFNGKAEFGPRALGARSIIADPRRIDAKEILNLKIKRRESFRPFAPSILKEYVDEYFEINDEVPFMEKVFPIKKEKQALIPAVTHVDGTGRLQTVDKNISPRYYNLIECFREKTGIPILLNTSFNENEPIVNSPEEALDCYLRTNMDMLVMENILISRL